MVISRSFHLGLACGYRDSSGPKELESTCPFNAQRYPFQSSSSIPCPGGMGPCFLGENIKTP